MSEAQTDRKEGDIHVRDKCPEISRNENTYDQILVTEECNHIESCNSWDNKSTKAQNSDIVQGLLDEPAVDMDDDVFMQGKSEVESLKSTKHCNRKNANASDLLVVLLSGLYGLFLMILGGIIPIAKTFADPSDVMFEAFYIYLYITSLIFIAYVYVYLLRKNRTNNELLTRVKSLSRKLTPTSLWPERLLKSSSTDSASNVLKPWKTKVAVGKISAVHAGSFYLRLGAVVFGIGSMIHTGLSLTEILRVHSSDLPDHCTSNTYAAKVSLHLTFTFTQLYFVFSNSKMSIHKFKKVARFGLMHMCATNICVWCRHIVVETLNVLNEHRVTTRKHVTADDDGSGDTKEHATAMFVSDERQVLRDVEDVLKEDMDTKHRILPELFCHWDDVLGKVVERADPYLYPCSIEYSIICAGILYIMWKNVGKGERKVHVSQDEDYEPKKHQTMSLDCSGSSRGLFAGIFHFVATVCCIIAFYVIINMAGKEKTASALGYATEISSYLLSLIAVTLAWLRMRKMHFLGSYKIELEDLLVLVSLAGLYVFSIFSIVADFYYLNHTNGILSVITNILMMLQATIQTVFMFSAQRMVASRSLDERNKPGKEFVTFLLISNFAMWGINTFETQRNEHNPFQVEFYGHFGWAIFTHISVPLAIFYRFHSTVVLSHIWKKCWKPKYRIT